MKKKILSLILAAVMIVGMIPAAFIAVFAENYYERVITNVSSVILDGENTYGEYDDAETVWLDAYGNDIDGDNMRVVYTNAAIYVLIEVFDDTVVNYTDGGSSKADFGYLGFQIGSSFSGVKRFYRGAWRDVMSNGIIDMREGVAQYANEGEYFAIVDNEEYGFSMEARFPVSKMTAEDREAFANGELEVRFTAGTQDGMYDGNEYVLNTYDGDIENRDWDGKATEDYWEYGTYKVMNSSNYTEYEFGYRTFPENAIQYIEYATFDGYNTDGEYDDTTVVFLNAYGHDTDGDRMRMVYTDEAIYVLVEVFDSTVVNYSDYLDDGTTKAGSSNCDFVFLGFSIGSSFQGIKRVYRGGAGRAVFQPDGTYVDMSVETNGELEAEYFAHVNNEENGFTLEARFPVSEMSEEDQLLYAFGELEIRFTAGTQDGKNNGTEFSVTYDGDTENRGWDGSAEYDYFVPSNHTGYKAKNPSAYPEYVFEYASDYEIEIPEDGIVRGECGDNITSELDLYTGVLTISGTGDMWDYGEDDYAPWDYYSYYVTEIIIEDDVTSIGDYAFVCPYATSVTIPSSVTSIGYAAFMLCMSLTDITFEEESDLFVIEDMAFMLCMSLTDITIPEGVTSIGAWAFYGCESLEKIVYCGTEDEWLEIDKGEEWDEYVPADVQYHDFEDGVCSECGESSSGSIVEFIGASVVLGKDLNLNYYVELSGEYVEAQMRFTMNGNKTVVSGEPTNEEGIYVFSFRNIAPQCMGDIIKAELVYDGEVIAAHEEYSILENAQNLLEQYEDDKVITDLVKAMLNYGAAAQEYVGYKTYKLVNEGYEIEGIVPDSSVSIKKAENNIGESKFKYVGVYFANANKIYAKIASAEKPEVTINGEEATVEYYGSGEWIVYSEDVFLVDFDKTYTIVITSNPELPTLAYSVNSYASI